MKKIFISSVVCAALFLSCKPEVVPPVVVKDEPKVINTDTLVPIKLITGIKLYNQGSTNTTDYKFYNITKKEFSNDVTSEVELAYVYSKSNSTLHYLGSSKSGLIRGEHGVNISNQTDVEFYKIRDNNNSVLYDTIKDARTITKIFQAYADLAPKDGEISSDGFGWETGELIGFKLPSGKRGLIKLTSTPTGLINDDKVLIGGRMVIDIKME